MTEPNLYIPKARSDPEKRPRCRRHAVIWEATEFSDLTDYWMWSLGSRLKRGCHFINPHYTISCPKPTAAFYRQACWARDAWINLLLMDIGPRGFRDKFKGLSPTQKQRDLSGVMFQHGELIPPPTWSRWAQAAFQPDLSDITMRRRPISLANLQTEEGRDCLAEISRAELTFTRSSHPTGAIYVIPGMTLSGPSLNSTFLKQAREAETDWHRKLHRLVGKERKVLVRAADLPTRMLVFHGVLAVNGLVYLPSCWPDKTPSEHDLKQTPFNSPTVPPEYLGLEFRS